MPINDKGDVWRKSPLTSGVEYPPTKEFFSSQSDLDVRVSQYTSCIWKPRHDVEGKSVNWTSANTAEIKALDVIRDKFHPVLTQHIIKKAHQSILPLNELVTVISKSCENLLKGEDVKMEDGDDIILSCKVVKVHSEDSTYTINDGTRDILRVPTAHLRRPHRLTSFDIETLITLTCSQSDKDHAWQVDEIFKKELGMKDKLAPIFCKPQNGPKKEAQSSEDDDVIIVPTVKKAKRESNDSLKENGEKEGKEKEEKKKSRPRKRKEETGEKIQRKKPKKEAEEVVINLESTDDEAPLSALAEKLKDKKQKQGFLDKFLTASPTSSKGSPSKKNKSKVEKAIEPLVVVYQGEDSRQFMQECDTVAKGLTKEMMESRMEQLTRNGNRDGQGVEKDILDVLMWRKAVLQAHALVSKAAKEEKAGLREASRAEIEGMPGRIVFEHMKERIKTAKALKEMEEEEKGAEYDESLGKLPHSGTLISSPHFATSLMISQFIFTRSHIFPSNYRLPMTEEIVDALGAQGRNKEIQSRTITYPIANILMEMILRDHKLTTRYAFCDNSISKLKLDEYSMIELIRVLVTGERPSTKAERDRLREEMEGVKEEKEKKDDEGRPPSPDENEDDEEENEADITLNDDDRMELVAALEDCEGKWENMDGRRQGLILEFLLNCFMDCDSFEMKTDAEVQEEHDDLKKEKRELKTKMDEKKNELKEMKKRMEEKEALGLRAFRADTALMAELEEFVMKSEKRMEEINVLMKAVEKELDMAKYASRLDPLGVDRHGRRYMLMPHYAGLLIQSTGSGEWIKDNDGNNYFGFIESEEEWRRVIGMKEWEELSEILKKGSLSERKLAKAMEKNKERFKNGLEWMKKVEETKKKEQNGDDGDDKMEEEKERPSIMDVLHKEMEVLLEKSENGELLKVKDISNLHKKTKEADTLDKWRSLILQFEKTIRDRAKEKRELFKVFKMVDETRIFFSFNVWVKRAQTASLSEVLMLIRVLDYRITWNWKDMDREKEAKKKEEEDRKKEEEEMKKRAEEEKEEWHGVSTRRHVEQVDKKDVRALMKRVSSLATGRLAATLNSLESDDERMMNMKDVEEECHRYSLEKLKKVLRKQLNRWRDEIESRFVHRLEQFDEFAEAVHEIL